MFSQSEDFTQHVLTAPARVFRDEIPTVSEFLQAGSSRNLSAPLVRVDSAGILPFMGGDRETFDGTALADHHSL